MNCCLLFRRPAQRPYSSQKTNAYPGSSRAFSEGKAAGRRGLALGAQRRARWAVAARRPALLLCWARRCRMGICRCKPWLPRGPAYKLAREVGVPLLEPRPIGRPRALPGCSPLRALAAAGCRRAHRGGLLHPMGRGFSPHQDESAARKTAYLSNSSASGLLRPLGAMVTARTVSCWFRGTARGLV